MFKILLLLVLSSMSVFASEGMEIPDLTKTWVGWSVLVIFVIAYYFIATEEKYNIDKSKPALFAGISSFMLIAFYYSTNSMDMELVHTAVEHLILEISEIFFFLFVAMTYIETMEGLNVFELIKYKLISKGYTYKKLFWITGFLAFFISPIADNLTTALILSTVLYTIGKDKNNFIVPGAINIVVAANAGGVFSPFGDITTLMAWSADKGSVIDFIYLFPAAFTGYIVTAFLLSTFVSNEFPNANKNEKIKLKRGAKVVISLGIFTIFTAVMSHQFLHLPAMWGMMFGLTLPKLYDYILKRFYNEGFKVFSSMEKIEYNTLLFFFGILSAVGALHFVGWLQLASSVYSPDILGPTVSNISVGFLSAIVDNVPVMSAIIKANPIMDLSQWMLVTLTTGIGGSLISFGSAAGVGVMGKLKGIYTFSAHMKYSWTIVIGFIASVIVWYLQYIVLGIGV